MKMKLSVITLFSAVFVNAVVAMDFNPTFYMGADAQVNRLKNGKEAIDSKQKSMIRKKSNSLGVLLGTRINEYVGAEVGYHFLKKSNHMDSVGNTLSLKMRNAYADALAYLPINNQIDLIGALGLGRLNTKTTDTVSSTLSNAQKADREKTLAGLSKSKVGVRLGVGAQYKLNDNLGVRFMVRHQKGNKMVKTFNSAGLGMFYQF